MCTRSRAVPSFPNRCQPYRSWSVRYQSNRPTTRPLSSDPSTVDCTTGVANVNIVSDPPMTQLHCLQDGSLCWWNRSYLIVHLTARHKPSFPAPTSRDASLLSHLFWHKYGWLVSKTISFLASSVAKGQIALFLSCTRGAPLLSLMIPWLFSCLQRCVYPSGGSWQ